MQYSAVSIQSNEIDKLFFLRLVVTSRICIYNQNLSSLLQAFIFGFIVVDFSMTFFFFKWYTNV